MAWWTSHAACSKHKNGLVILFKICGLETSEASEANEVEIPNVLAKILMNTVCSGCCDKTP